MYKLACSLVIQTSCDHVRAVVCMDNGSGGSKSARRSCSWSDSWSVVAVGLLGGRVVGFFWIAGLMDRGIEGAKENNIGGSTDEAKKE